MVGRNEHGTIVVAAWATVASAAHDHHGDKRIEAIAWGEGSGAKTDDDVHYFTYTVKRCGEEPPASSPPPSGSGKGFATIAFDDGWLTTYTTAYPILRRSPSTRTWCGRTTGCSQWAERWLAASGSPLVARH